MAKVPQTPRRRIYLMRHGNVSYFDDAGRPVPPNTVPLTPEGQHQANLAARELADVPLDRAVASDLRRCVETATLVTAGRNLPIETHETLREIHPGRLRDLPIEEVEKTFLGAFREGVTREGRFLGGESYGSLWDRVTTWFRQFVADPSWRHALVVAHGGVNRVLLAHALGGELALLSAFEQDPCCLNILDVDDAGRCLVRLVNHTPYATVKLGLELTTMERLYMEYKGRNG